MSGPELADARRATTSRLQRASPGCEEETASNPEGEPPLLDEVSEAAVQSSAAGGSERIAPTAVRTVPENLHRGGGWPLEESVRGSEPRVRVRLQRSPHALDHFVQRGSAKPFSGVVQRAGDPSKIPPGLSCPTDLTASAPSGTDILFPIGGFAITAAHTTLLTTLVAGWLAGGGTDDLVVHGYASTVGNDEPNWRLSCNRAAAVRTELERLGVPPVRIPVLAHGETTEFSASRDPNQRAVVTTRAAGPIPLPIVSGVLTPRDNFAGRSTTRFGVGENIDLSFFSLPPTAAASLGGLEWHLVSGGGTLAGVTAGGLATYTAPGTAGAVRLELRVAAGATAGRVVSAHPLTIVTPDSVRIRDVPGTAPNFRIGGTIPAGNWGAGFLGEVFVGPRDVSFQGVVFGEGTVGSVITGSFLAPLAGAHPVNTFGPAHGGNAATGTPVSPPRDQIFGEIGPIAPTLGIRICGSGDFLWAIPWEFSVAGGARTPFATANHHMTSTLFCDATIEKGGAGPFTRPIV